jgi:hypothetical protein
MLRALSQQEKGKSGPNFQSLAATVRARPPMPIVFAYPGGVKQYQAECAALCPYQPDKCPECATVGRLVKHGVYWRKPRDGERVYRIAIHRWRCKACRHTLSALPDFLLRFRWYLLAVVSGVVVERAEQGASWNDLQAETAGAPVVRTMQRWWQALGRQAGRWLDAVQTILAQQDSPSPWLDAHGEAAQAPTTVHALLGAAGHLLAWAKSRWTELARYGWKERLRFLWLWGSGQGLGRLV